MGLGPPQQPLPPQQTDNKKLLLGKLTKVMGTLKHLQKEGWNQHHKYNFVQSEDVINLIRSALVKEGLFFSPTIFSANVEDAGKFKRTTVHMILRFFDSETAECLESQWFGEALDSHDKGLNKAITACIKYFLLKIFLIPVGEEPDSDNEVYENPAGSVKTQDAINKIKERFKEPEVDKFSLFPKFQGSSDGKPIAGASEKVLREYIQLIEQAREQYKKSNNFEKINESLNQYEGVIAGALTELSIKSNA